MIFFFSYYQKTPPDPAVTLVAAHFKLLSMNNRQDSFSQGTCVHYYIRLWIPAREESVISAWKWPQAARAGSSALLSQSPGSVHKQLDWSRIPLSLSATYATWVKREVRLVRTFMTSMYYFELGKIRWLTMVATCCTLFPCTPSDHLYSQSQAQAPGRRGGERSGGDKCWISLVGVRKVVT